MFQTRDRTGLERIPVHDGRVQFVRASACEDRAFASVEMRIVFQEAHGGFGRIETRAAAL